MQLSKQNGLQPGYEMHESVDPLYLMCGDQVYGVDPKPHRPYHSELGVLAVPGDQLLLEGGDGVLLDRVLGSIVYEYTIYPLCFIKREAQLQV